MISKFDIEAKSNETIVYQLNLTDPSDIGYDLTQALDIKAQARDQMGKFLFEFIASITDAQNGIIELTINGDDTADLWGLYLWDIRINFAGGYIYTNTGKLLINKAITLETEIP